jgi:FkbM family methyltransferase
MSFASNLKTAVSNPRLLAAWVRWKFGSPLVGRPRVPIAPGGTIGGFPSFSDYWNFQTLPAAEQKLLAAAVPTDGIVLDIGANIGLFSVALGLARPNAVVHAFEPVPETFRALQQNLQANGVGNVVAHRAAVSDNPGVIRFTATNRGSQANHVARPGEPAIEVPCRTLDEFVAANGLGRIDFLKVDVEGYEPWVFRGAKETLGAGLVKLMLLEIIPALLVRQGSSAEEVFDLLGRHGYSVYDLGDEGAPGPQLSIADVQERKIGNYLAARPA